MKKKRILAGILVAAIAITMSLIILPDEVYAAAKKPSQVVLTSVKSTDYNAVKITWNKAKNAKKYQVWRATSKNGKYKLIKTTTAKTFTNKKLTTGKKYYFKVRAINGSQKGKFSIKKYAIPKLKRTVNVKLTATETTVKLTWTKVNGAKGYQVYRSATKNGTYKKITTTSKLSFTNKKLTANNKYYYKVRAYTKVNGKFKYGTFSTIKAIKTNNHSYISNSIAATCTNSGHTLHTCTNCGDTYKDDILPTLGHDYVNGVETGRVEPTCVDSGVRTVQCARCNAVTKETIPAKGHAYGTWRDTEATCTEQGYSEASCTNCGDINKDHIVPALGHDWFVEKLPNGTYEEQCSRGICGAVRAHSHSLEKVYRDKTADETMQGYYEYTTVEYYGCQECGGQLIEPEVLSNGYIIPRPLSADSPAATLAKYQAAHNKYHEGKVTPTYGTVVAEQSEPVFVSQGTNKVLEGEKCTAEGCDYFAIHNHNCSVPVELPTSEYQLASTTTQYWDKLVCNGCRDSNGDYTVYRGGVGYASMTAHSKNYSKWCTTNRDFVYDTEENICTYHSVMSTSDKCICTIDGCTYIF